MAKLNEAERVLLRAVLYLLRDSEQRAQVEIPTAGEARAAELSKNLRLAEDLLRLLASCSVARQRLDESEIERMITA
jgi:hypothetical protein